MPWPTPAEFHKRKTCLLDSVEDLLNCYLIDTIDRESFVAPYHDQNKPEAEAVFESVVALADDTEQDEPVRKILDLESRLCRLKVSERLLKVLDEMPCGEVAH